MALKLQVIVRTRNSGKQSKVLHQVFTVQIGVSFYVELQVWTTDLFGFDLPPHKRNQIFPFAMNRLCVSHLEIFQQPVGFHRFPAKNGALLENKNILLIFHTQIM